MKQFLTKKFLLLSLLISTTTIVLPETSQTMPSVADVFGGLSEQQIAEQVQMGQQFLEDLQKNGSPEEIAEFQRLLESTLNSMTEEDFKDIQAIAQMVEPHLTIPQNEIKPIEPTKIELPDTTTTSSDLDEFKKLISTITQRIDDIFQKINSSKDCAEQVDAKWKNKSTFNNMKRQIYQLKTDRLAQKLCKKDLKDDDKKLVNALKDFLKDLTAQNNTLVIEDDFGLPTSHAQEQKHLKQTKSFLDSCDDYIDKLMPLLETFLQKWDPEALQIAKETEIRNKKAAKDATDATVRKASADVRAKSTGTGSTGYKPAAGYQDYGGYYPESYGQSGYPGNPSSQFSDNEGSFAQGTDAKTSQAKPEVNATAPTAKEKTKDKSDLYNYAMSELEGHVSDDFDLKHENTFVDFMQNNITNYPDYSLIVGAQGPLPTIPPQPGSTAAATNIFTTNSTPQQEEDWIDSKGSFPIVLQNGQVVRGFKDYVLEIKGIIEKDFYPEFAPLHNILNNIKNDISNMTTDELKKLSTAKDLTNVENRLRRYQKTFDSMLPTLELAYKKNTQTPASQVPAIIDPVMVQKYQNAHDSFIKMLKNKIGDELDELLNKVSSIKRSAKRTATRKQKSS